ncbi:phosphatase PAP2 family protein [Candidatus Mycosynbacter amalyticus]|uniref:Phosphatase PAP2 family protein n=1 Tax=Candidatus Mycosynbacter amalyticus TaxID=2665156 RepID=A0A857MPE2_9BACT|nr:phosphatase PAP2 family protein [Candidatus Mycosynbacter amalyticus]QHN42961.1 phosphatase PAP2 family protein [Candidatus Mycosynbacter amalyticus]
MDTLIKVLADGIVVPLVLTAVVTLVWLVPNREKFRVYSRMLLAGLTSYFVAKLMALAWQPSTERPFELLGVDPGASYLNNPGFPSDHALFVWVLVFAVWYGVRKPWLTCVMAVVATLVCLGRVLALVHTPLDVAGGVFAAAIGALWYLDDIQATKKLAKK